MKTLILVNNVNNLDVINAAYPKIKKMLADINFAFDYDIKTTNAVFTSVPFIGATADVKTGYQIHPNQIAIEETKHGNYDVVALLFDSDKIKPNPPTNPTENAEFIQIPVNWYGHYNTALTLNEKVDTLILYFLHELCHERFWATSRPDITHNFYTSAFSQKTPTEYYLHLLSTMRPAKVLITKTQFGMQNANVFELQRKLIALGFLKAAPTGYYGPATKKAVLDFQLQYKIIRLPIESSSGTYCGAKTVAALNAL